MEPGHTLHHTNDDFAQDNDRKEPKALNGRRADVSGSVYLGLNLQIPPAQVECDQGQQYQASLYLSLE
jgi:hypothetical protein